MAECVQAPLWINETFRALQSQNFYMSNSNTAIPKHVFAIVGSLSAVLLLAFGIYALHRYEQKTKQPPWYLPSLAKETINGVQNPYRLKEFVYRYGAGKEIIKNKYYMSCRVKLYSLFDDIPKNTKSYLRQLDKRDLKAAYAQDKDKLFIIIDNQEILTTWMSPHELKPSIFNPFDEELKKQEASGQVIDLSKQGRYLFFQRCLDFIMDTQEPYTEKAFIKMNKWDFYEHFKSDQTKEKYNQ